MGKITLLAIAVLVIAFVLYWSLVAAYAVVGAVLSVFCAVSDHMHHCHRPGCTEHGHHHPHHTGSELAERR